jgi:hypothetical protein
VTRPDEPIPEQTTDDTDVGWGDDPRGAGEEDDVRRLLDERPPHHEDRD